MIAVIVGAAVLGGCQPAPSPGAAATVPRLDWQPCPDEEALQCATAPVPRDHSQPDGPTLTLALVKAPAQQPEQRIGSLLLNRGGPGYSTIEYMKLIRAGHVPNPLGSKVWARYDVLVIDQRGVGQSRPAVRCFASDAEEREFAAGMPPFPITPDEQRARAEKDREYAQRCRELSGDLLDHVTTANAARDMDLIRAGMGEERLHYLGQSYGTYLGIVYANLFPDRIGRVVFDSIIDPERHTSGDEGAVISARRDVDAASQATLEEFFRLCAGAGPGCGFGTGDPAGAFERLIDRLRSAPVRLTAQDSRTVDITANLILNQVGMLVYQPVMWEAMAVLLKQTEQVLADPDGESAAAYAAAVLRQLDTGHTAYAGPLNPPFYAVTCTDTENPRDASAWPRLAEQRRTVSPYFAALRAYDTSPCAAWQGTGRPRYAGPWDTRTDTPVLIVNSRFDPSTPLESAVRLRDLLPASRLLVNDGWGHIAAQQSSCIVEAISAYLVDGRLPSEGGTCRPDRIPFS
jgi:pimeloyl-ACP methyl ester carboxylesterase